MATTRAQGWGVVILVALGAAVAQAFGRFTYSVLLPAVRDDLGVSNTVAGLLGTAPVELCERLEPLGHPADDREGHREAQPPGSHR